MLFEASSFKLSTINLKKDAACLTIKPVQTELRSSQVSFNTYERVKGDNRTTLVFMKRLHGAVIVALKRNVTFNLTRAYCKCLNVWSEFSCMDLCLCWYY